MEKFTSFLKKKYQSLSDSREVTNANKGKEGNKIQNYLDRIERITSSPRGKQLLQHMIMKDFVMKDDEETLTYLARALYQSEKKIAIERGQTNQIQDLEQNDSDLLNKYRNAILEKRNIQKRTLDSWLSYLGNTNDYPMWFKYYTARSLKDMGQFNRHDTDYTYEDKHSNEQVKTVTGPSYSNRTEYTIAPFPELNSEALGFVRKAIETQIEIDSYTLPEEVNTEIITHTQLDDQTIEKIKQNAKPENIDDAIAGALKNLRNKKRSEYINTHKTELQNKFIKGQPLDERREDALTNELTKRLDTQDFAKLYAFAMVECAGSLDRSSLEGEWVKYNKGSDYTLLEDSLKGKGTGWCTAEGSAKGQIENGDFYVYYTKNKDGQNTEPRIAIRMDSNGQIGEIRGVEKRQEMEPELVDTAKEFYKDLPGSDKYEKKDADMKYLTSIYNRIVKVNKETKEKTYQNIALSKEELRFLYEMDSPIESFGYDKDPRIAEIRSGRDIRNDLSIIYETKPEYIAFDKSEITPETKICIKEIDPYETSLTDLQNISDDIIYLNPNSYQKQILFVNPIAIDWNQQIQFSQNRATHKNSFIINPETQKLNYENLDEPTILFKPEWVGKLYGEVFAEVIKECNDDYYIPGIEYQTYLSENADKIPPQFKNGYLYFMPGFFYGKQDDNINILGGLSSGSLSWLQIKRHVDDPWSEIGRIVLFRKPQKILKHD